VGKRGRGRRESSKDEPVLPNGYLILALLAIASMGLLGCLAVYMRLVAAENGHTPGTELRKAGQLLRGRFTRGAAEFARGTEHHQTARGHHDLHGPPPARRPRRAENLPQGGSPAAAAVTEPLSARRGLAGAAQGAPHPAQNVPAPARHPPQPAVLGPSSGDATSAAGQRPQQPLAQQPPVQALPGSRCEWAQHDGKYLGEFADTSPREYNFDNARRRCEELEEQCLGVTCVTSATGCTPRRGIPHLAASPAGEVSYTKSCKDIDLAALVPELAGAQSKKRFPGGFPLGKPTPEDTAPPPSMAATAERGGRHPLGPGRAALVVIAHNQPECLQKCLSSVVTQPDVGMFSLAVSLDDPGSFQRMETVIQKFNTEKQAIAVWHKPTAQSSSKIFNTPVSKISEHFRFALTESFDRNGFEYAIFLENDLTMSPDFLWYFRIAAPLLEEDRSLFCVSAWNDNGFKGFVANEHRLFRTDYFPGLGWMIRNDTWAQLRNAWPRFPSTGWDHWLRHGSGLRPRECIVPEVPRTHHFGTQGTNVHKGSQLAKMLDNMEVSRLPSGALSGNLSYLIRDSYEAELLEMLRGAPVLTAAQADQLALSRSGAGHVLLVPYVRENYRDVAKRFQIIPTQPRTAHRGIVITRHPRAPNTVLALVDRRWGEGALPERELWRPHPQQRAEKAAPGESCAGLCSRLEMRCEVSELEFVNTCEALRRVFPCEDGCGHQVGQEIPAYVHDRSRDTALQCLVTDDAIPTCETKVPATTRLCACVPK